MTYVDLDQLARELESALGQKRKSSDRANVFRSTPNTGHRLWRSTRGLPNKYRRPTGSAYARQRRRGVVAPLRRPAVPAL